MSTPSKRIRDRVPPRDLYVIVYECGATISCRNRASAELTRMTTACTCKPLCGARIIRYRRGSLFGRGAQTWYRPLPSRGGSDG